MKQKCMYGRKDDEKLEYMNFCRAFSVHFRQYVFLIGDGGALVYTLPLGSVIITMDVNS